MNKKTIVFCLLAFFVLPYFSFFTVSSQFEMAPKVVYPGDNVTVYMYAGKVFTGETFVKVSLKHEDKVALEKDVHVNIEKGSFSFTLNIPHNFEPGKYDFYMNFKINETSFLKKDVLWVCPSESDIAALWAKISEAKILLDEIMEAGAYRYDCIHLNLLFKNLSRDLREISEKTVLTYVEVERYEEIVKGVRRLEERINTYYVGSLPQRLFKDIDNSLNFDYGVILSFWRGLLGTFLWLFALSIVFLPFFMSDFRTILLNLIQGIGEDVREKVMKASLAKAKKLIFAAERDSETDVTGFLLMVVASVLATAGLLANNIIALIGSMLIAPLLTVVISSGVSVSFINVDERAKSIFPRSVKNVLILILISVAASVFAAAVSLSAVPITPTAQLLSKASPNLGDLAIAASAGLAGSIIFVKREYGALAGVAIAIALVPPSAAVGTGIAMLRTDITIGALASLTINIVAIIALSYLSAKAYAIIPAVRGVLEHLSSGKLTRKNVWMYLVAVILNIDYFVLFWIKTTLGLSPQEDLTMPHIKNKITRVVKILLLIFSPFLIAFLISTNVSLVFSWFFQVFNLIYTSLIEISGLILLYLPHAVCLLSFFALLKLRIRKPLNWKKIISLVLFWGSLGYLVGLYLFPKSAAIFSLLFMSLVYLTVTKNKTTKLAYGFAIFALSTTIVYSVGVFNIATARYYYAGHGIETVSKEIIANVLNISSENLDMIYIPEKTFLMIKIFVEREQVISGDWKMPDKLLHIAEESIRSATSIPTLKIRFEYVIVP